MNTDESKPAPAQLAFVMWIIWASLISGVIVLQYFLGGGWPQGKNPPDAAVPPFAIVGVVIVILATAIRWLVLPRFDALNQKFVMMILGMSLAEGAGILGIFLLPRDQPETRIAIFVLALLGMAQFAPIYAQSKPAASFR